VAVAADGRAGGRFGRGADIEAHRRERVAAPDDAAQLDERDERALQEIRRELDAELGITALRRHIDGRRGGERSPRPRRAGLWLIAGVLLGCLAGGAAGAAATWWYLAGRGSAPVAAAPASAPAPPRDVRPPVSPPAARAPAPPPERSAAPAARPPAATHAPVPPSPDATPRALPPWTAPPAPRPPLSSEIGSRPRAPSP
jgi:hypothetical protein